MNTEPLTSTELHIHTPAPQTKPTRLRSLEPLSPLQPSDIVVTSHRDGGLVCITAGVGRAAQVRVDLGFVWSTEKAAKIVKEGGDHARRALVGMIFGEQRALGEMAMDCQRAMRIHSKSSREWEDAHNRLSEIIAKLIHAGRELIE